jgi:hypothetical protein
LQWRDESKEQSVNITYLTSSDCQSSLANPFFRRRAPGVPPPGSAPGLRLILLWTFYIFSSDRSASNLDLHLEIDSEGWLRTKLYHKRDDFNFPIVNFPFICSNILAALAYGVYISQLIKYFRACGSYQDLLDRGLLLTRKQLNQGLLLVKLKSSLRKFYGRHHDLVDRYGISVSQVTMDMFHLSKTLLGPFLIHDLSPGL